MKTIEQGLKQARVLTKFKRNFVTYRTKGAAKYLPKFLNSGDNMLYASFPFDATPEGHNFWVGIHKKLNKYFQDDNN